MCHSNGATSGHCSLGSRRRCLDRCDGREGSMRCGHTQGSGCIIRFIPCALDLLGKLRSTPVYRRHLRADTEINQHPTQWNHGHVADVVRTR